MYLFLKIYLDIKFVWIFDKKHINVKFQIERKNFLYPYTLQGHVNGILKVILAEIFQKNLEDFAYVVGYFRWIRNLQYNIKRS